MGNHQAKRHTNTALRQRAREMLMDGRTPEEVAAGCGVHLTTVWRWRRDPVFAGKLAKAQEARLQVAADGLRSMLTLANQGMRALITNDSTPPAVKLKAYTEIYDRTGMASKAPPSSTVIVDRKYSAEELEAAKRWILENGGTDGGG